MADNRRASRLNQQIDENLRRVYSDTASEPLPEQLVRLLEQLRKQSRDSQPDRPGDDS